MYQFDNLPAPVREKGLFCCWRYEDRDGKPTKVPYNPATGQRAQSNNPDTFTSFTVATMAAVDYSGIGVGIFGELGAIDLDHCLTDSGVEPWAREIVDTMHSYTEVSPSGEGLRILFPVEQPFRYDTGRYYVNRRIDRDAGTGIEVYVAGATQKYVTVTGEVFPLPFDTPFIMKHHCTHLYLSYTTDVKNRMSMKAFLMIAIGRSGLCRCEKSQRGRTPLRQRGA